MRSSFLKFNITEKNSGKYIYNPVVWDLTNQLRIHDFLNKNPDFNFELAGKVVEDKHKTCGFKIEVFEKWKNKKFILYLLVINNKIVKGGKSKNPLPQRTYGAGTEKNWTEKGSPSETNYVYSQIFRQCIKDNISVEFYALQADYNIQNYNVFGKNITIETSPYEEMESILNRKLVDELGKKPIGEGKLLESYKS